MATDKKQQKVVIELAEKHHVTLNFFQKKPYFHIKNIYSGKTVSLGFADMKSLVEQFDDMKVRLKQMKRSLEQEQHESSLETPPKKKKKNNVKNAPVKHNHGHVDDDVSDDDEDEDF